MLKLCRAICFLPRLPDVFIWRCHEAKLQINKAISTSQLLTLSGEDLLGATHKDLTALCGRLDIESHTGLSTGLMLRRGSAIWEGLEHQGLFPANMSERPDLFHNTPPAVEAVLWSGSSFLSRRDLLIFSETVHSYLIWKQQLYDTAHHRQKQRL